MHCESENANDYIQLIVMCVTCSGEGNVYFRTKKIELLASKESKKLALSNHSILIITHVAAFIFTP